MTTQDWPTDRDVLEALRRAREAAERDVDDEPDRTSHAPAPWDAATGALLIALAVTVLAVTFGTGVAP